jgi:hypothetical protein
VKNETILKILEATTRRLYEARSQFRFIEAYDPGDRNDKLRALGRDLDALVERFELVCDDYEPPEKG